MILKTPEDKQEEVDEEAKEIMDEVHKAVWASPGMNSSSRGMEVLAKRVAMLEVLLAEVIEEHNL